MRPANTAVVCWGYVMKSMGEPQANTDLLSDSTLTISGLAGTISPSGSTPHPVTQKHLVCLDDNQECHLCGTLTKAVTQTLNPNPITQTLNPDRNPRTLRNLTPQVSTLNHKPQARKQEPEPDGGPRSKPSKTASL